MARYRRPFSLWWDNPTRAQRKKIKASKLQPLPETHPAHKWPVKVKIEFLRDNFLSVKWVIAQFCKIKHQKMPSDETITGVFDKITESIYRDDLAVMDPLFQFTVMAEEKRRRALMDKKVPERREAVTDAFRKFLVKSGHPIDQREINFLIGLIPDRDIVETRIHLRGLVPLYLDRVKMRKQADAVIFQEIEEVLSQIFKNPLTPKQKKAAQAYLYGQIRALDEKHDADPILHNLRVKANQGDEEANKQYLRTRQRDIKNHLPGWVTHLRGSFRSVEKQQQQIRNDLDPVPIMGAGGKKEAVDQGRAKPKKEEKKPKQAGDPVKEEFNRILNTLSDRKADEAIRACRRLIEDKILTPEDIVYIWKTRGALTLRALTDTLNIRSKKQRSIFKQQFGVDGVRALIHGLLYIGATKRKRTAIIQNINTTPPKLSQDKSENIYTFLLKNKILNDKHSGGRVMIQRPQSKGRRKW